ncbi:MAG: hypothetical protein V1824_04510 [archaeon]
MYTPTKKELLLVYKAIQKEKLKNKGKIYSEEDFQNRFGYLKNL